jgi:parallel beta-helix repeat protein
MDVRFSGHQEEGMRNSNRLIGGLVMGALLGLLSCGESEGFIEEACADLEGCDVILCPSDDDLALVQTAFIEAEEGSTVCLAEGTYTFQSELSIDVANLTVRGTGMDETILDFGEQLVGSNGMHVTSDGVLLEGFQVLNPAGDGIRASDVDGIVFRALKVLWESEGNKDNGGYGLYPVQSNHVLVEDSVVSGASDSGIYVGQSTNALIRNNVAHGNVAGIEIENTTDAEVHDNHTYDNTGGILIFNLPDLPVKDGKRANVHHNLIENNNRKNFAKTGNVVALVPQGTGMFILASDSNELHHNTVTGNQTLGVMVLDYTTTFFDSWDDLEFDPNAEGNFIHHNTLSGNGEDPKDVAKALPIPVPLPDLVWDGCFDAEKDNSDGSLTNCFFENGDATYSNLDLCNDFADLDFDITPVTCERPPLESVVLE